jgi:hypothetical protein
MSTAKHMKRVRRVRWASHGGGLIIWRANRFRLGLTVRDASIWEGRKVTTYYVAVGRHRVEVNW